MIASLERGVKLVVSVQSCAPICSYAQRNENSRCISCGQWLGRVVFRGDIVKEDSGSYAVFREHGSSASRMTAAQVMVVSARPPKCAGQAADAESTYILVNMEDASTLLKLPKTECPDVLIRPPRHKWPISCSNIEDLVVLLGRNQCGHPLAGLLWERLFEKVLLGLGWEQVPNSDCFFVHRKQGLCLSVFEDDVKMIGRKQKRF